MGNNKINNKISIALIIAVALCVITWFLVIGWIMSPTTWTLNINLTADDNVLEIVETAERMQNKSFDESRFDIKSHNYSEEKAE